MEKETRKIVTGTQEEERYIREALMGACSDIEKATTREGVKSLVSGGLSAGSFGFAVSELLNSNFEGALWAGVATVGLLVASVCFGERANDEQCALDKVRNALQEFNGTHQFLDGKDIQDNDMQK